MTSIKEHIGTKDSGRIGTLLDKIDHLEYKLILRRDNSNYNNFIPLIINSKGRSDSIRYQFPSQTPLEVVQRDKPIHTSSGWIRTKR